MDASEEHGGRDALIRCCRANEITWPQYYQGNGPDSEFSSFWKVRAIPTVFVVDQQGNLYSVEARDKLDEMIPELLGRMQDEN